MANNSEIVLCIKNGGHPASLEILKVYRKLSDHSAQTRGFVRVVDESGEDYLYPDKWFLSLDLSPAIARAVKRVL
jgi:hypothetical protein